MRRDAGCWVRGRRRRTLGEDINPRSGPSDGVARAEWESTFSKLSNIHGAPTKARGFHRGPREAKSLSRLRFLQSFDLLLGAIQDFADLGDFGRIVAGA